MGRVHYTLPIVFMGIDMPGKRLIAALVILTFLAACGSDPTRGDGGQGTPQTTDTTAAPTTSGGGGGNFDIPSDPRAALLVLGVIAVFVAAEAVLWTVDYIKEHSNPSLTGTVQDAVYRAKDGSFAVALPGDSPPHDGIGVTVREVTDHGQQQVVFLPAKDGEPLYGVSVQRQLPASDAAMSLADYASKLYPSPVQDGRPLKPVLDEMLTLDAKPALFREYSQTPSIGAEPVYYLLYFFKSGGRSALVSVTWTNGCPKCATGPEADIRAMDPHLKEFVESFHLADAAPAN